MNGLVERGIGSGNDHRYPIQLTESDLQQADCVIALHEAEHRPYLESRFPGWADRIEYWHIPDRDQTPVSEALAVIEENVLRLLTQIK
jgi:protein-tyrosine phosphatase